MDIIHFDACGEVEETFGEGMLGKVPYVDKKATLFRTGTHKGKVYGIAELDRIASQFSEPATEIDWTVPLQIDHSDSARDSTGNMRKVWREGDRLMGRARYIGQQAVDKVESGVWRKLSIGLRPNLSLHHVAVTPHPYVTDAQNHTESEGQNVSKETETTAATTTPAPVTPPAQPDFTAQFAAMKADLEAQFSAKTAEQEAKIKGLQATVDGQAEVLRFAALTAKVDTFSGVGKTLPPMRDKELELLKTFSADQIKLYGELKDLQPAFVDFKVYGFQETVKADASMSVEDETKALLTTYGQEGGK